MCSHRSCGHLSEVLLSTLHLPLNVTYHDLINHSWEDLVSQETRLFSYLAPTPWSLILSSDG